MIPIFPTAYFGSIAYYKELVKHDKVLIEAMEHFPKQSYRNRFDISTTDGLLSLSCPVVRSSGSKTLAKDIVLSEDTAWRRDHWRSIVSAYNASPYFEYYSREIEDLIFHPAPNLLEYNLNIHQRISEWLDLKTKLEFTNDFLPIQEADYRLHIAKKNVFKDFEKAPYIQVFPSDSSFKQSISILDAILCLGPMARNLLIVQ